ncbi:MAG: hypothetical protein F6J93_35440 [Oscillatoria sp. SIO1A7]|nr:hypothetical protein [Oscillatoria sp. SIO1A7]
MGRIGKEWERVGESGREWEGWEGGGRRGKEWEGGGRSGREWEGWEGLGRIIVISIKDETRRRGERPYALTGRLRQRPYILAIARCIKLISNPVNLS